MCASFLVEVPFKISLSAIVRSHGWIYLRPWDWNKNCGTLSRPEVSATGRIAHVGVRQINSKNFLVEVDSNRSEDVRSACRAVKRWLSTNWDPGPAIAVAEQNNPSVADFIEDGGGRILRGTTFYEDFVKTVCTIQIAWSGTIRMVSDLIDKVGGGVFPTPMQILAFGETGLREKAKLGFRSRTLYHATDRMLASGLIDVRGNGAEESITYEEMIALYGIGPYAASHLMVLLNDFRRIPVDSEVRSYCREKLGIEPDQIEPFFARWSDYKFLGYKLHRTICGLD